MRKLIFVGMAVSVALIVPPRAHAMGGEAEWCRIARDLGGRDCSFHTLAQCAMSTERLNGGGCIENPGFRGAVASAAVPGARTIVIRRHHKTHHDVANR